MELSLYPFLIATGQWLSIGRWPGMTAAGWRWQTKEDTEAYMREAYMRFFLGNALVIVCSFILAHMIRHGVVSH